MSHTIEAPARRKPRYLSHSALQTYKKNVDDYVLKYLTPDRTPREPQGEAQTAGSAVDARIKVELTVALFGKNDPRTFDFTELFESQVEPHVRDYGMEAQAYLFDCYTRCGRYGELLAQLEKSDTDPQFEASLEAEVDGVQLLGKPDAFWTHGDLRCILDFKVRGFASKYAQSPTKQFRMCRDSWVEGKPSRAHGKPHPGYMPIDHKGFEIHAGYLETMNPIYAAQTIAYAWLLGAEVGSEDTICYIDEFCCKPIEGSKPNVRIAELVARVSKKFQLELIQDYKNLWTAIETDTVVDDETFESLAMVAKQLYSEPEDSIFLEWGRV